MAAQLNPYLSFRDNTREAMEFYQSVLGGELSMNTFEEFGAADDPGDKDKIMHSQLETEDGFVVMAADTPSSMEFQPPTGFSVSISGDDEDRLRRYWDGLSAGGTVVMPFEKAPWGDTFGMCVDRYGVSWMVNVAGPESDG